MDDLQKILKDKYGAVKSAAGGNFRIPCFSCALSDQKKMKRYVHPNHRFSKCYICEVLIPRDEIVGGVEFSKEDKVHEVIEHPLAKILPFKNFIPINQLPPDHPAIVFLAKDHLHDLDRYWKDYRIGFIPYDGAMDVEFESGYTIKSCDSIIFPVTLNHDVVGWQCRFVPGTWYGDRMSKMKYLHLFQKGNYLFNYDIAKKHENVIVVEGIKKALKNPACVATLGKGISDKQIQLIQEWKYITLLLDGDDKTQEKAKELELIFKANSRNCVNINPSEFGFPSPDEMTEEELATIVENAWKN